MPPLLRPCLAALLLVPALAGTASADDDWTGFYRGIDPVAGSLDAVSIVPEGRGAYEIVMHASRFGLCEGADRSAVVVARGAREGRGLTRTGANATCADGATHALADGHYRLLADEALLTLEVADEPDRHYHRTSND